MVSASRQAQLDLIDTLEIGDLVRLCGRNRIVRDVTRKDGRVRLITFSILRRSWTNKPFTVYSRVDLYGHLTVVQKGYGAERTDLEKRLQAFILKKDRPLADRMQPPIKAEDVIGVVF